MSEVLLLGAGASYGSVRNGPRPPLGKDLYGEMCKVSPTWRALPHAAVAEFQGPGQFEQGFGWVRRNCDARSIGLLRDMALYFLELKPGAGSLYLPLLAGARRRGAVQLATLNYDLMIEICMMQMFDNALLGLSAEGRAGLLKLHGSPNLVPAVGGLQLDNVTFANMGGSAFESDSFSWLSPRAAADWIRSQPWLAPTMALYEAGKYVPIGGSQVQRIQGWFGAACAGASRIYIAGTSYQPHDAHVWDPIVQSGARITVADPYPDSFKALEARVGSRLKIASIDFETFAMAYHDRSI